MYNLNNNKIESNKTIKCGGMNNNNIEKQQNHKHLCQNTTTMSKTMLLSKYEQLGKTKKKRH
jgi:hypothetical protein